MCWKWQAVRLYRNEYGVKGAEKGGGLCFYGFRERNKPGKRALMTLLGWT